MNLESWIYLSQILQKYKARDISPYASQIAGLKAVLQTWAGTCFINIIDSGSRAKGTAISLASDIDFLVSLTPQCNENAGGLKSIYESLFAKLSSIYTNARKQNVSIRINLNGLQVDVTPGRKQTGNTNNHNLYVSKKDTWKQTNIQKHVNDVSGSGRINEIKLLKIWRELNRLEFPSIYLEYLLIKKILLNKPKGAESLDENFWHVLLELAKDEGNPLFARIEDPANSANILSDLLDTTEKNLIKAKAKTAIGYTNWANIVY